MFSIIRKIKHMLFVFCAFFKIFSRCETKLFFHFEEKIEKNILRKILENLGDAN
jgi:hypothetical protein